MTPEDSAADSGEHGEHGEHEILLRLLYQAPIAIVRAGVDGRVALMNPMASRLIMELEPRAVEDAFALLERGDASLAAEVRDFVAPHGSVVRTRRVALDAGDGVRRVLSFTIDKLDESTLAIVFQDVTEAVENEERLKSIVEEEARVRGRAEMAAATLHDIGNAITAAGATLAGLLEGESWRETEELRRLVSLFEEERAAIVGAMGAAKADALVDFLRGVARALDARRASFDETTRSLARIVSHVEDVLLVHRRYTRPGEGAFLAHVDLWGIVEDALALLDASLEKRGIVVDRERHVARARLRADRTRLVQVVVNLLRNAAESFDRSDAPDERRVRVSVGREGSSFVMTIEDNGQGFEGAGGEALFERGVSAKAGEGGQGLAQCRSIVEAHGGRLTLDSDGRGRGAIARVVLPATEG